MKQVWKKWLLRSLIPGLALLTLASTAQAETTHLLFSAGPRGGTFDEIASAISSRLTKRLAGAEVAKSFSAGSLENLRRIQAGDAEFGVVYAGDLFLGRRGKLANDIRTYDGVQMLAPLYGAPAHLVVLEASSIRKLSDLAGKRVAVGGAGSGAAASAERFFRALGLWERIKPQYIGYQEAQSALGHRYVDAVWIFSSIPNTAARRIAEAYPVRFLHLQEEAEKAGFFATFPFHTPTVIPAGTYRRQSEEVRTFQDQALWAAGRHTGPELVYQSMLEILSAEGLEALSKAHQPSAGFAPEPGPQHLELPFHPGAVRYWQERGIKVPGE